MVAVIIFFGIPIFLIILWCYKSITVIPAPNMAYSTWLGKPFRLLEPGFYLLWWPLEKLHRYYWSWNEEGRDGSSQWRVYAGYKTSTAEMTYDPPPYKVVTKDRLTVSINIVVHFRITDVQSAFFKVSNLYQSMETRLETAIIHRASKMTLEEAVEGRHTFYEYVMSEFRECVETWGIQITRLDIQSVTPSNEIIRATEESISRQRKESATLRRRKDLHKGKMAELQMERDKQESEYATKATLELARAEHNAMVFATEENSAHERQMRKAKHGEEMSKIENERLVARARADSESLRLRYEAEATEHGAKVRAMMEAGLDSESFINFNKWQQLGRIAESGTVQFMPLQALDLMSNLRMYRSVGGGDIPPRVPLED